jgi:hypothetical protein
VSQDDVAKAWFGSGFHNGLKLKKLKVYGAKLETGEGAVFL